MFDLSRFLRLAAAQWAEYGRSYAWFIGIGIMLHFVLLLVLGSGDRGMRTLDTNFQGAIYFAGLYLTATIFAARYFQAMSRTESALVALMRPASSFEKWLLAFVVVAVLYPVAYTLAYYVCNLPASMLSAAAAAEELARERAGALAAGKSPEFIEGMWSQLAPEQYRQFHLWQEVDEWQVWLSLVLSLGMFQAFAVLGSLYFRAMPFIKTVLAGFLLLLASILLVALLDSRPDGFLSYWHSLDEVTGWQAVFFPLAWFLVPGLLWLACFFALREREIA